ncbi:hypothetical protein AMS68_005891 [Peltaster fructicola]|uniref:RING-type domain-containing protein n=1 Tax=Peltaster fructicola TaxID=286661 RepID=A0A6H0Y050_9PEZI|nr:hypothetical protein AMS68_005891 [Peltaster fructicola]
MKFGREYKEALASEAFPEAWVQSAIDYRILKKCIKKVRKELSDLGLDGPTINHLSGWLEPMSTQTRQSPGKDKVFVSVAQPDLATISEEFTPQLRLLVDARTGQPLDATLAPETRESLRKIAQHELLIAGRHADLGHTAHQVKRISLPRRQSDEDVNVPETVETKWIQVPLASAADFFTLLEPKLEELDTLNQAEAKKLEEDILDLGEAVEDVTEPVREGFEAKRTVSYRDLYFWREMFRLYMEKPIFYSDTEMNRGALTFNEAKKRLRNYDDKLRSTGLLAKMKTPQAKAAAQQFLDLNINILRIMHFQEMNAKAMTKILKKFDKQTHLEGTPFLSDLRKRHPALLTNGKNAAGGFANSIARDLHAEIATKVLPIVPQLDDWTCPVCYAMAWRPVNLGCCRSVFCIRCIIKLQDDGMKRCPCCNKETVMSADGNNIDWDTTAFLEKYFPLEAKGRQKENEMAQLARQYGDNFVKPSCTTINGIQYMTWKFTT